MRYMRRIPVFVFGFDFTPNVRADNAVDAGLEMTLYIGVVFDSHVVVHERLDVFSL